MERFYQDLSQAVKQVPKGDMLLVMGDFNAEVGRREPSAMSSAVGLYGLGETNEAGEQLEDFCYGAPVGSCQYHVQTTSEAAVYLDLS